jgi:hypothetical protein
MNICVSKSLINNYKDLYGNLVLYKFCCHYLAESYPLFSHSEVDAHSCHFRDLSM